MGVHQPTCLPGHVERHTLASLGKAHMCSVGPLLNKTTSFVKAAQQRPPYVIHGRQCPRCPNPLPTHEGRTAFLHAPPPLRIQTLNHAVG